MDSEHEIRDYLDRLVATGCAVDGLEKQWHDRYPSDSRPFRRRATKAWLAEAKRYRDIRHWGKFRRALILGAVVWGHPFTVALEQAALLLPGQEQHQEFSTCLRDLARQIAGARVAGLSHFADRVRTYRVFDEFSASVAERGQEAKRLLVERPFRFGRTLIAFTNLHFLREQFLFDVGEEFQHIFGEHGSPEHLAEAASTLIALANEQQPLESIDFTFPLSGIEVSDDFISLLRYGAALQSVRETGKMISILSYELVRERATRPRVYRLQPAHPEIEYALRLGFIRGEIGRTVSGLNVSRHESEPPISMLAGAEDLLNRLPQVAELKDPDTPYRRVRLQAPLIPQLYDTLSRIRFYEDALHEDRLGQELELPMRIVDAGSWEIVPGLDLETFHKTWRTLTFLALLDVVAIRRHQSDPVIVYNSLMRAHTEDRFVELLHVAGVDPDRVPVFLDLIAADVKRLGFYDMQYRPFLRVGSSTLRVGNDVKTAPPEIFHASGVIVTSNVTVNVQRAHGLRIKTNADAFVAIAEATLKKCIREGPHERSSETRHRSDRRRHHDSH